MGVLAQNLKFAMRQLRHNPGFTTAVVFTLALSIGANTAIFSIVNVLLLKSLPYPQPDRLGAIFAHIDGTGSYEGAIPIDGEQWELLRDKVPAFTSAVSSGFANGVNLQAGQRVQYLHAGRISVHYLDVLQLYPAMGRNFTETEDLPGGPKSTIVSYDLWRNTFGADPNLLGKAILLKGEAYTVIGVLPEGVAPPMNADLYTAIQPSRQGEGGGSNYQVITRLKDGASWQEADSQLNHAWAAWAAKRALRHPGSQETFHSVSLKQGLTAGLRPKVETLMLAAGLILLIACANLAGVTLVRMERRTKELVTRLALGASCWQIQTQLWTENLLLAVLGGLAGLGVGFAALRGLLSILPLGFLPVDKVPLDERVLVFTLLISVLTSVLFGMLPAFATRKVDLRWSMASRAVAGGSRLGWRQTMIAGEVALTVVLLAASGLLIRTLIHLQTLPPGFHASGVMTAKASLDDVRYHDPATFQKLLDTSLSSMRRIPGVKNAAMGLTLPYERSLNDSVLLHDGDLAGKQVGTDEIYVTPGYFNTLEIPLLQGRDFNSADGPNTQPVVIVNRSFANKFFHGADPVGHVIAKNLMIVGVVGDVQLASGLDPVAPLMTEQTIYAPAAQMNPRTLAVVHVWFQPSWIVRTAGPIEGLTEQMQKALASADPGLPFSGFYRMGDLQAETLSTQRVEVALLSAMAALALLLSTVGVFALVASTVTQKTREIGIRIALGSSVRQVMSHVAGAGMSAAGSGLVVGLVLCFGTLRVMRSVLYGVGVYDFPTIAVVVATLALVTFLAASIPVLRIARIDPATTLRDE